MAVTRRDFLKTSATAAAGAVAFSSFFVVEDASAAATGQNAPDPAAAGAGQSIRFRFSTCQNCHSRCGLMCKVVGPTGSTDSGAGVLVKIDGNPYNPQNMEEDERLGWSTPVSTAVNTPGRLCPKGQAGVQVLYDPYRIKHPLKRVGSRGAGKWQTISWNQAFTEIAQQINTLIPTANRLTTQIDANFVRLGPIANGLVLSPGRLAEGQFNERIFKNVYGTSNYRLDHTSICEVSHHVSNELMTWEGGKKNHFKPDIMAADYMILFGANYLECNFPMLGLARKTVEFKKAGKKLVVVDPRFSNSAAKADRWVPAKPGTDAAVALGIATHIIKDVVNLTTAGAGSTDSSSVAKFLRNANKKAANDDNETCWTDAARLVIVAIAGGVPASAKVGEFLRVQDYLPNSQAANTNTVAWVGGVREIKTTANPGDEVNGDLLPGQQVIQGGELAQGASITVKTVFQLLYDNVIQPFSVEQYANIAGVEASQIKAIAVEFFNAGKKAVANPYRGTVQHTNGLWSMMSVTLLNALAGNYDWQGGNMLGGGGWTSDYTGMTGTAWNSSPYKDAPNNFGNGPYGPRMDRAKATGTYSYENLRNDPGGAAAYPYPARRPWFPYGTHGNYQEIIPGIAAQYPFACKVLITYWNAMPYSIPAQKDVFQTTVLDTAKVPLFIAIDNVMGEVSALADYILPDTTYLEKWAFPGGSNVSFPTKYVPYRQPVVGTFDNKAWDADFDFNGTNGYTPIYPDTKTYEDILIGLMNALGLTADIGDAAKTLPVNAWAVWKPAVTKLKDSVNGAADPGRPGNGQLTEADIIARGGAFQDPGNGNDTSGAAPNAGKLRYKYANSIRLYYEELAGQVDSMGDGNKRLAPTIAAGGYLATAHYDPVKDIKDQEVQDLNFPFQLITYKKVLHGQARTQSLPWLTIWQPENFIELNAADASALGLRMYDRARVSSPSNTTGIIGRVRVTQGLRPGVVAISHHFGHWQQSSQAWTLDGATQPFDSSRQLGIQPTLVMRIDPVLGDVSLQEKIGASCSFYDTRVKVEKV
ncbi:MAG: molybdopterin-dependent oxidoreductase [Planctomycetes bacterium]|nr:molybdopterin-dependent oxidoreductase [Planctomycetota bacterium]